MNKTELDAALSLLQLQGKSNNEQFDYGMSYGPILDEKDDWIASAILNLNMQSLYPTIKDITNWIRTKGFNISKSAVKKRLKTNDCFEIVGHYMDAFDNDEYKEIWNFNCDYEETDDYMTTIMRIS